MSEEETPTTESDRYILKITSSLVHVLDLAGEVPLVIGTYPLAEGMAASERCGVLNRRAAAGMDDPTSEPLKSKLAEAWRTAPVSAPVTPQEFLTQTLPAKAAEQRSAGLSGLLAEVREVETEAIKQIREFAGVLNRAIEVRQRIEDRIAALSEQTIDSHSSIS